MRSPEEELFLRILQRNNAPREVEGVNRGSGELLAQSLEEKAKIGAFAISVPIVVVGLHARHQEPVGLPVPVGLVAYVRVCDSFFQKQFSLLRWLARLPLREEISFPRRRWRWVTRELDVRKIRIMLIQVMALVVAKVPPAGLLRRFDELPGKLRDQADLCETCRSSQAIQCLGGLWHYYNFSVCYI
jgi:hypothetical protein